MIEACDKAYDRAKYQTSRGFPAKNAPVKQEKSKSGTTMSTTALKEVKKCSIKLDVQKYRHSVTLRLKKLFRSNPGNTPVELSFYIGSSELATLQIDASAGVHVNSQLKGELAQIEAVMELNVEVES